MAYLQQFKIESDSRPGRFYVVSESESGEWQCDCVGWTRHVPRRDCKHIRWAKMGQVFACDPMLRAMELAINKVERSKTHKV